MFRQGELQFRPQFEDIRAKFYREMRRFIGIPGQFRGVTEQTDDPAATGQVPTIVTWKETAEILKEDPSRSFRLSLYRWRGLGELSKSQD